MHSIGFFGAAETVTGSRHIITIDGHKILVDCGLFQGSRELRQRNWEDFPVDPAEIEAVIITHAHTDHIGWLPRLVAQGFHGPIYATAATIGLTRISLPDSARLQEEEARQANKRGSRHDPALPLYTESQAFDAIKRFKPVKYDTFQDLPGKAVFRFLPAGHILGSAIAEITFKNGDRIVMSGDLGRYGSPIIRDPASIDRAEYLVVESTYGDRLHDKEDVLDKLEWVMQEAWKTGGTVVVPSFAIGRTQELLYAMRQLQNKGRLPRIPIFIDSPMAVSVTYLYEQAKEEMDEDMLVELEKHSKVLEPEGVTFVRDTNQSKALNSQGGPMVIVSGSGMANGGRVLHHLLHHLSEPNTIVLFTGYQAEGTLGRRLLDGAKEVRLLKQEVTVRARIERMHALSAHADQGEIMQWLGHFTAPPKETFIVHGEPPSQEALREKIQELGWKVTIPKAGQTFKLGE